MIGRFDNITATVFGGRHDENISAYGGHRLTDTGLYVALPYRFKGKRPRVQVWHGEAFGIAKIEDVGPWMIDDDYWTTSDGRPMVETYYKAHRALPRGPNRGRVPSNDAGIDLSPALARLIGLRGMGEVNWMFYTEQPEAV